MSSENLYNLSIEELKKLVKEKNEEVKKLEQEREKEKLILACKKLQKKEEKLIQEKNEIKQKSKPKSKPKSKTKSKTKSKPKSKSKSKPKQKPIPKQKIKTFDEYFQECIKNKTIPKDTSHYLKKALERAMKEYDEGIKHEKSALSKFAENYTIDGKPGLTPIQFFAEKATRIKDCLRNHRNIKVRMILICEMESQESIDGGRKSLRHFTKVYFNTETYINLEKTDVKVILSQMIDEILEKISAYQENGSGWYFKEVTSLEIHTVDYKPIKGSSCIPLPDFLIGKKVLINMENKDDKCFLWCVLRYLHPKQWHEERVADLREYENDLNFKGIEFPVKVKDIQKFENNNPDLPGINVFSVNDNNKIYPLRLNQKDAKKSIVLFLF